MILTYFSDRYFTGIAEKRCFDCPFGFEMYKTLIFANFVILKSKLLQ